MLGLLHLIKTTGSTANLAAVGIDLEALGLALDSPEPVTRDWDSCWSVPSSAVSAVNTNTSSQSVNSKIPPCYILPPSVSLSPSTKITSLADETLFYIFYGMTRDRSLQEMAAKELTTARSWRYHVKLQLWLTVEEGLPSSKLYPTDTRTFTVCFDPNTWTRVKRSITIDEDGQIEDRFLKPLLHTANH